MENILDDSDNDQSIDLSMYSFRGKLSGMTWKREQALNQIATSRKIIFLMSLLVFYPILRYYMTTGIFNESAFLERLVYGIILLLCGLFFYRNRLVAMIIASLPILIILAAYLFFIEYFPLWIIAFNLAILFLIGRGIYAHFRVRKIERQLKEAIRQGNPEVVAAE